MIREYAGKVAIITGAANGLGRALAEELASRGCHLALLDLDSPALGEVRQRLAGTGILVTHHRVDVSVPLEVERTVSEIADAHGGAHLLINNAAISASALFANTPAAEFETILRVNFFGVVYGCRAFLPLLQCRGEGQILNVSSCFAWLGYPRKTAYAASMGAIRSFSESLRVELADRDVGVTTLYPGPLDAPSEPNGRRRTARLVLDRLTANPGRIVIGLDHHLIDLLARFSPRLAAHALRAAVERAAP